MASAWGDDGCFGAWRSIGRGKVKRNSIGLGLGTSRRGDMASAFIAARRQLLQPLPAIGDLIILLAAEAARFCFYGVISSERRRRIHLLRFFFFPSTVVEALLHLHEIG